MKITVSKTHIVTFTVQEFHNEEGGMGHEHFSAITHKELGPAIEELAHANLVRPKEDWIIVVDVETNTNTNPVKE